MVQSKTIYKNLILAIVTAAAFVAVTVAWFVATSGQSRVEAIEAHAPPKDYQITYYAAVDKNKDDIISGAETYEEIVRGEPMDIVMMPGKTYFFRIDLLSYKRYEFSLLLDNVFVQIDEESALTAKDIYDAIKISISCTSASGPSITPRANGVLTDYILDYTGTPEIPVEGTLSAKLVPTFQLNIGQAVSVYYEIGLDGSDASLHLTQGFQGAKVNVDNLSYQAVLIED
ncbi:MAG TPA: hypothetical protein VFD52_03615 [Clostridia bacterium]|nr:hypothetical protein [Clostridia bacterium]